MVWEPPALLGSPMLEIYPHPVVGDVEVEAL